MILCSIKSRFWFCLHLEEYNLLIRKNFTCTSEWILDDSKREAKITSNKSNELSTVVPNLFNTGYQLRPRTRTGSEQGSSHMSDSSSPTTKIINKKASPHILRIDAIEKRVVRGFKNVVKAHFEDRMTEEIKESPELFYKFVMHELWCTEIIDVSTKNEDLFLSLGVIWYLTIKTKFKQFILNFPKEILSIDDLKHIIKLVEEYNHSNSHAMTSAKRKKMLHGIISQLGKLYFENGEEDAYWFKIKERVGIVIENEDEFMRKLRVAMDKVGVSQ